MIKQKIILLGGAMQREILNNISVEEIRININNPRTNDMAIQYVVASIKKSGYITPIIIDEDNMILAGHTRYKALLQLGFREIPVVIKIYGLTKEQKDYYIIADNKTNELASWDWEKLGTFDEDMLKDIGFSSSEMDKIIRGAFGDPDDIPEPALKTEIKLGDMIKLGPHLLLCGDSTDEASAARLMGSDKAKLVFTSPPYWVGLSYEKESTRPAILEHIDKAAVVMAKYAQRVVINTGNIASMTTAAKITGKKQPALLVDWWIEALNKQNMLLRHIRIWAKHGGITPSRRSDKIDMHWEYIAQFTEEEATAGFIATFNPAEGSVAQNIGTPEWAVAGIWQIQGNARETGHVAAMPTILPQRYMIMYTTKDDLIYEPYAGSGTTIIAAQMMGRIVRAVELDPLYCELIAQRFEKFTGIKREVVAR